jgi:Caspase domain
MPPNPENPEVELYKKNRIVELTKTYNKTRTAYIDSYNLDYSSKIISSKDNTLTKKTNLINLNKQYNETIKKMTAEYNNSVSKINLFKVTPINIQNRRALLVGISDYSNAKGSNLYGCVNDVLNFKNTLLTLGYKDDNIKTILDQSATAKNILDSLTYLLTSSVSGDLLIFQYSGHGDNYAIDKNGDELNTTRDEEIFCADGLSILDDTLKDIIMKNLKPDVTLFALFDCCFSGSVLDLRYQYMDTLHNDKYIENMNTSETPGNVIMISCCTDMQESGEVDQNDTNQGAMTWSFLESLNDAENNITWRQLIVNMRKKLMEIEEEQKPQISSGKIMELDAKVFI